MQNERASGYQEYLSPCLVSVVFFNLPCSMSGRCKEEIHFSVGKRDVFMYSNLLIHFNHFQKSAVQ